MLVRMHEGAEGHSRTPARMHEEVRVLTCMREGAGCACTGTFTCVHEGAVQAGSACEEVGDLSPRPRPAQAMDRGLGNPAVQYV